MNSNIEIPDSFILQEFYQMLTPERIALFDKVINQRTNYITVISEDIFQEHNASAIVRTCDSFGIQTLHLIETRNKYQVHEGIARGSNQWVTLEHHFTEDGSVDKIIQKIKSCGYKIVATSPHAIEFDIFNVPLDEPIAIVFGAEKKGVTEKVMDEADYLMRIPMYGFAESLNVSASVAIVLNQLRNRINESIIDWKLNEIEKISTLLSWCRKHIKSSELIENEIRKRYIEKML